MNIAKTILILMLFSVSSLRGNMEFVYVGGEVPKPGPVNFTGEGMTIDSAMAVVGMDLGPFYNKARSDKNGSRCPIRIEIWHQGEKTTYDPSVDAAALRVHPLKLNDTISVTDFRQHPKKIEVRRERVERMLELGSTEIGNELLSLATMQSEYEVWSSGAASKGPDEYLRKEAARLVEEGKGQKIISILDLRLSALQLDGIGPAHPVLKQTKDLIGIFRKLVAK